MLLLDTHALLWLLGGDNRCTAAARAAIEAPLADVRVSAASLWEIEIKHSIGKLALTKGYDGLLEEVSANGFELLGITTSHLRELSGLQFGGRPTGGKHKDPFDRLLVAQARWEGATLVTAETWWKASYGVKLLW